MKNSFKILALLGAILLLVGAFASCDLLERVDRETEINVTVLSGSTGFGAAKMINESKDGKKELNYRFTVETDPSLVRDGLINGSIDIAALPTNVAATLYNKTNGKVKIAAVNTLGVLYLVTNGEPVTTIEDIKGKTLYCPANNPAYILEAICNAHGLEKSVDYTLETVSDPKEIASLLIKGDAKIAVIPEPLLSAASTKIPTLVTALDLTEEWEKSYGKSTLMQGCIAVRTEWAEAHPVELEQFLSDYRSSVEFTNSNPKAAAQLIADLGIAESASVTEKAIPKCNIVYIDDSNMADSLDVFFKKLYETSPAALGGVLPDRGIYLIK